MENHVKTEEDVVYTISNCDSPTVHSLSSRWGSLSKAQLMKTNERQTQFGLGQNKWEQNSSAKTQNRECSCHHVIYTYHGNIFSGGSGQKKNNFRVRDT